MPSALEPSTTLQPGILLIEEYDALAAAFGSALKKFAPGHRLHRAKSLAEAEKLAKTSNPELFVIDFDPAYPGLTEFLQKMRGAHPDARVLVVAAGVSPEIAADRRRHGALQFMEKPFELSEFGAAVQALLGPWKESENGRGTLSELNLGDIVLLQCVGGRTVAIEAKKSGNGLSGQVHVKDGQLRHVEAGKRTGADALEEMLAWPEAKMRETDQPLARKRTIEGPWLPTFLKASHQVQAEKQAHVVPSKKAAPAEPPPKTGKKIVVIDDTEMLLIFVEDVLSTDDPELRITTALNGTTGIKEVERISPDLVLLDYSLPDFNGDEVCRRLLQNKHTANIPVLMMSGHVAEMSQTAAVFDNVVATIEKPFLSDALIALVKKTLAEGPRPARKAAAPAEKKESPPVREIAPPARQRHEPRKLIKEEQPLHVPREAPVPPPVQVPIPRPVPAAPVMPEPALQPSVTTTATFAPEAREARPVTIPTPVVSTELSDVVLGLFLEVVSMQLTDSFRMGAVRAKPSSSTVSLHVPSAALRAALPANGFQLGRVELDRAGRIATLRLIPTQEPFRPLETRNAFQIAGVAVVPENSHERVQLTPMLNAPMTMQLQTHLEVAGVELSSTFQIEALVLKTRSAVVRVTLSSQTIGQEGTGAACEIAEARLDTFGRITELRLNPVK